MFYWNDFLWTKKEKKTHNQSNKIIPGVQISNFIYKGSTKLSLLFINHITLYMNKRRINCFF